MEKAEDIRYTIGNKQIYQQRKETIERLFGTAKEQHGFRYTQYIGESTDGNENRAYIRMYESEKIGKDTGVLGNQTRRIIEKFKDFLKTMSIYRKVVLGDNSQHHFCLQSEASRTKQSGMPFMGFAMDMKVKIC